MRNSSSIVQRYERDLDIIRHLTYSSDSGMKFEVP